MVLMIILLAFLWGSALFMGYFAIFGPQIPWFLGFWLPKSGGNIHFGNKEILEMYFWLSLILYGLGIVLSIFKIKFTLSFKKKIGLIFVSTIISLVTILLAAYIGPLANGEKPVSFFWGYLVAVVLANIFSLYGLGISLGVSKLQEFLQKQPLDQVVN